jgi:hypothetical protein
VTQHTARPSSAVLLASIRNIRAYLATMVDELHNFDGGDPSEGEEASAGTFPTAALSSVLC